MKKSELSFKIKASDLMKALRESSLSEDEMIYLYFPQVSDLKIHGESSVRLTPDDYHRFAELIKVFQINLKDMRDIIMLANSWWVSKNLCSDKEIIENYLTKKDEFRDNVYSWELISLVLNALSGCENPVTDFYSRIKRTNPEDYQTFEEYLKAVYTNVTTKK